jgi:hypothetical protein
MQAKVKKRDKDKADEKSGRKGDNVSLAPLTPEEAIADLLRVRPQPKLEKKRRANRG